MEESLSLSMTNPIRNTSDPNLRQDRFAKLERDRDLEFESRYTLKLGHFQTRTGPWDDLKQSDPTTLAQHLGSARVLMRKVSHESRNYLDSALHLTTP